MRRSMEIDVWSGDWGLPSIDVNSLQILVYCKFAGAPVDINVSNNPYRQTLPTFHHDSFSSSNFIDVVKYLKTKNINADYALSNAQVSQVDAYCAYLKEKLFPALQYVWWIDTKNYTELSRPWYAKVLPFPLNYYYPGRYEREAKALIGVVYGSLEEDPNSVETQVYSDAEKCLTMLSTRLGDSQYFLGNSPTSLDALIFSYLAPLLKAPFPRATLQNHLKGCSNLVAFVHRIIQKYYPSLTKDFNNKTAESKKAESETEFPNKGRNKLLFGIMASAAMTSYAFSSGLLQVSLVDDDDDDYDDIRNPSSSDY